eukprot:CAMPEP_0184684182 /NCGR_PEP_ID=MMETSP0312-20130426/14197_1 /TAXON_ID=31354 /ORGANISM="Compsopogon coeruleus, Strain SAG 36.94" /LENGTH=293 /DNA_ID=CAMNT_0027137115 /DNA_START=208 /DNA_END=1089 /DNA_ORIENTATION=+
MSSRWGAEDVLGSLNLQNKGQAEKALGLIRSHEVVSLGLPVDRCGPPPFGDRTYEVKLKEVAPVHDDAGKDGLRLRYVDDRLEAHVGTTTHMDSPFHVDKDGKCYNGVSHADIFRPDGMIAPYGCHRMIPICTRGVFLDIAAFRAQEYLLGGELITVDDIVGACRSHEIEIERGDFVIFHTGWIRFASGCHMDRNTYLSSEPGIGKEAARYLAEKDVMGVGADTVGVEVFPHENPSDYLPIHGILLIDHGIWLMEMIDTRPLVDRKASTFCLMASPPRYTGVVQIPVNPLAIF